MNLQALSILGKRFFYLYSVMMVNMKVFWSYIKWFVGKVWAYVTIPFLTFWSRKYLIRSVVYIYGRSFLDRYYCQYHKNCLPKYTKD